MAPEPGARLGHQDLLDGLTAGPFIIGESDPVTDKFAEATRKRFGLAVQEHPLPFPEIPINLFWHRRYHRDAGNRWLRGLFFAMFAE